MAQVLINTRLRNGYDDGFVVHVVSETMKHGRLETPENGFISMIISGMSDEDARKEYLNNKLSGTEVVSERDTKIVTDNISIPVHPAAARMKNAFIMRAGRSIRSHLEQDRVLPVRKEQVVKAQV